MNWINNLKQRFDYKARFERLLVESSDTINGLEQQLLLTESEREALKDGEAAKLSIMLGRSQMHVCSLEIEIAELEKLTENDDEKLDTKS